MIDGCRVLAIVPARSGSKGLPGKNIRELCGKPLLAWPVEAAREAPAIDDVIISTDSSAYAEIAVRHGARAPFLRPSELASDTASSVDFILHALDWLAKNEQRQFDYVALLEPTSPLTTSTDITSALEQLIAAGEKADAIVGISEMSVTHPAYAVGLGKDGRIAPAFAPDFANLPRRQEVERLYALDGSLYISSVDAFRREESFYHSRTIGYVTPRFQSFEVDDLIDFVCIEAILKNRDLIAHEDI
ncbi:MAG: acylneuraminate cytidylyltransferase family protein [Novosphingobium sp.]|nr:acylneuraminate cytidylyltransferase family protein [Novosphingobium sp.]